MVTSESIKNITVAMVEVQKEIKGMTPDAKNPFFKSNYITLDGILEFVRPILSKNNVWLFQNASGDMDYITVTTRLVHNSGEYIETDVLKMKPQKVDPQQLGSCITYAKRYQLASLLGISSEVDDDGNKATFGEKKQPKEQKQPVSNQQDSNEIISQAQAKRIYALAGGNVELCKEVCEKFGYKGSKDIRKVDYDKICKAVEEAVKKNPIK